MDYMVHGILQARILEWVAFPFPSPEDLPNPGIEPRSPALQTDFLPSEGIEYTCQFDPMDALPCVEGQKKRRNAA